MPGHDDDHVIEVGGPQPEQAERRERKPGPEEPCGGEAAELVTVPPGGERADSQGGQREEQDRRADEPEEVHGRRAHLAGGDGDVEVEDRLEVDQPGPWIGGDPGGPVRAGLPRGVGEHVRGVGDRAGPDRRARLRVIRWRDPVEESEHAEVDRRPDAGDDRERRARGAQHLAAVPDELEEDEHRQQVRRDELGRRADRRGSRPRSPVSVAGRPRPPTP